jgi:hypothetical protein
MKLRWWIRPPRARRVARHQTTAKGLASQQAPAGFATFKGGKPPTATRLWLVASHAAVHAMAASYPPRTRAVVPCPSPRRTPLLGLLLPLLLVLRPPTSCRSRLASPLVSVALPSPPANVAAPPPPITARLNIQPGSPPELGGYDPEPRLRHRGLQDPGLTVPLGRSAAPSRIRTSPGSRGRSGAS